MLRIRFLRVGKKNSPSFRLVVTPKRTAPQTGRFLEMLGSYDPRAHSRQFKKERILYWLSQGAQPSDTAHNMLVAEGIIEGAKVAVHSVAKKDTKDTKDTKEATNSKNIEGTGETKDTKAEEAHQEEGGDGGEKPSS